MFRRIVVLVMDSVGIGEQPDAVQYISQGANTFRHAASAVTGFSVPNLQRLGLGNIPGVVDVPSTPTPLAHFGRMVETTSGNDTFAGIWEMGGVIFTERFESYNPGIPSDVVQQLQDSIGMGTLCNAYVSGFRVYDMYADEHFETRKPIIYTNDDGVVLIGAHEDVIPPAKMHEIARQMTRFFTGKRITRIIGRAFVGTKGNFIRTENRIDIAVPLDKNQVHLYRRLRERGTGFTVTEHLASIIGEEFPTRILKGIKDSTGVMAWVNDLLDTDEPGVSMFVVPDFDMSGHKRDAVGYGKDIVAFDTMLGGTLKRIGKDDLLLITADHGCDPVLPIRGHTREYVPLLVLNGNHRTGSDLGTRHTFADLGQTICDLVGAEPIEVGTSFASQL
ncbi:MAG: phosphopentomutase [Candidatus Kerfeldbacteria bacterium]|nr:phosphopentomutase [Candidatus Kerfeldbacteria bacterium]